MRRSQHPPCPGPGVGRFTRATRGFARTSRGRCSRSRPASGCNNPPWRRAGSGRAGDQRRQGDFHACIRSSRRGRWRDAVPGRDFPNRIDGQTDDLGRHHDAEGIRPARARRSGRSLCARYRCLTGGHPRQSRWVARIETAAPPYYHPALAHAHLWNRLLVFGSDPLQAPASG